MNAHMFPFGHGSRVCGGQNMAQIVLRIVLAIIVRNFDILAPPETNTDSMAIKDSFVSSPHPTFNTLRVYTFLTVYKGYFPGSNGMQTSFHPSVTLILYSCCTGFAWLVACHS